MANQIMYQEDASWILADNNGIKRLEINTNDGVIVYDNDGKSYNVTDSLAQLEACVKADTQILMADGSTKNISDIKYGDMIKGWDVDNNCTINVKAYGSIKTGSAKDWTYFVFEDGKTVEIYDNHGIYSKTYNRCYPSKKWDYGDIAINQEGEDVAFCFKQNINETEYSDRYVLVSENNTYFCNGILCAMDPPTKMRYYNLNVHSFNKNITEEDVAFFRQTADMFNNRVHDRVKHLDFFKVAGPLYAEINTAKRTIKEYKKLIATQDYKTIKYTQGKLSEEEFQEHSVWAQNIRDAIGVQELKIAELENQIIEHKKERNLPLPTGGPSWKALYNKDMETVRARIASESLTK